MERITQFQERQDPFGTFIRNQHQSGQLSSEQCASIFGRLIVNAALDNDLTERLAERWGTHAGHYGLLALLERETDTFAARYFQDNLPRAMSAALGFGGAQ